MLLLDAVLCVGFFWSGAYPDIRTCANAYTRSPKGKNETSKYGIKCAA